MRGVCLGLLALSLGSGACKRENPAFQSGSATTGVGSSSEATGASTGSATSQATESGSSSGTTGEICEYGGLGRLDADVLINGESVVDCGTPFQSWGFIEQYTDVSTQTFQMCDSKECTNCSGTFDLMLTGPADTIPRSAPQCVRVTLEKEAIDPNTQSCLFSGIVLARAEDNVVVVPMFAGSSKIMSPPAGLSIPANELGVNRHVIDSCNCAECCEGVAQEYELEFTLATDMAKLQPTQSSDTMITDLMYRITNLQSHDALVCGNPDNIDWTVVDVTFLQ